MNGAMINDTNKSITSVGINIFMFQNTVHTDTLWLIISLHSSSLNIFISEGGTLIL